MANQMRTMDNSQQFVFPPDILFQTLEDESILVNLKTENIFGLNETGSLIAGFISEEKTFGEIVETLNTIYKVSTKKLERETIEILLTLINHGLILKK